MRSGEQERSRWKLAIEIMLAERNGTGAKPAIEKNASERAKLNSKDSLSKVKVEARKKHRGGMVSIEPSCRHSQFRGAGTEFWPL